MDHRAFLASLSPEERRAFDAPTNRHGLARLALHFGAIAALGTLIGLRVPLWPLLMVPQGILLVFLFTLLHETSHRTAFRTPWLNTIAGWLCAAILALPPAWFRFFHLAHHRHTHDPARDPELATPKPETPGQYALHISGLPIWWSHLRTLARNAAGRCDDAYIPAARLPQITGEARAMLALYAALLLASLVARTPVLLFVWLLPLLAGQPFLRLFLLAEHGRCPHVANMFENTRTTFTNATIRALAWNMPFHAEHHASPNVPFHRLPALHRRARAHLRTTAPGYAAFNRAYAATLRAEG